MRATPLKIMTTARRSVHTLIGSNEAFRTRTRAFMVEAILREPLGKCQKSVSKRPGSVCERGTGVTPVNHAQDARAPFPSVRPPVLRQPKREVCSPHHVGRELKGKPRQVIEEGAADDGPFDGIGPAMPETGQQGAGRTE